MGGKLAPSIGLSIDGRQVFASEGDTILSVARANNIYIPAICCLTRCSPTLACRLCMTDADGKRVYSCNAKVKEGMTVVTDTPELRADRRAIMEIYAINHPLQCGVCDKSGECELQDNTLFQEVSSQSCAIKDLDLKAVTWGRTHYDPALCIVCERCVTVCKDMIGVSALATVPRGGEALDESYKESLPKDAYAIWNKMNKSLIAHSPKGDNCTDCGECAAVCPTGAMIASDFQYKSNAWELRRVPSSCVSCPSACHLVYEIKQGGIDDPSEAIYRVTNDFHFQSLCASGRFGYDYANKGAKKDEAAFARAVAALKQAKAIRFASPVTNEEILILNRLKKLLGIKLINPSAFALARFLKTFGSVSGRKLYSGSKATIGDFTVSIGVRLSNDNQQLRYAINNALVVKKGAAIDFHPVGDAIVDTMHKNMLIMRSEVGEEEIALAKLLNCFADKLPDNLKAKIDGFVFGEAELEQINKLAENKSGFTIIAGSDLFEHPRWENLARMLGLLERYSPFKVVISPLFANDLGAALFADLDESAEGYRVGYNASGDFALTALGAKGENELDMPALIQQEGTIVSADRRVVPIYPALGYGGWTLAELYNALAGKNDRLERTVDLSAEIGRPFDELRNEFGADGEELRGFELEIGYVSEPVDALEPPKPPKLSGVVLYSARSIEQLKPYASSSDALLASEAFLEKHDLNDGNRVKVTIDGASIWLTARKDKYIRGEFAFIGVGEGWRFKSAKIAKG
ncbi:MAG: NADH-quinone oxidoreductase subunit G [Helicobacteraceae bacterium]|jgi:NADH-quinone oxidoreductase subunit G|nr:NADH-quinone oxidoreductase subunit G [Helicobacteraceae bacterium]